jgi:hypothetical protein
MGRCSLKEMVARGFNDGFLNAAPAPGTIPAGGSPGGAESRLRFRTARELFAESPTDVPWIAEPFIASGALTFIEGRPKIGKSTFAGAIERALLHGESFLGRETVQSPIVMLSEAGLFGTRLALERAGVGPDDPVHVLTLADRKGLPWPAVCAEAAQLARSVKGVLFVDTLGPFSGVSDENDAAQALAACGPLMEAAASGIAVVAIRHERKSSGDVGEAGRGSNAYTGAADSIISIRKSSDHEQPSLRELHLVSRLPLPFDVLTVDFDGRGFRISNAEDRLLEIAEAEIAADPTMSRRMLQKKLKIRAATAADLLRRARSGEVVPTTPLQGEIPGTIASIVAPGSLREIGNREPLKMEDCGGGSGASGTTGTIAPEKGVCGYFSGPMSGGCGRCGAGYTAHLAAQGALS